ncbi:hypothetical protein JCM10207_002858 [Rhodosporidiobolus poonsookiae]
MIVQHLSLILAASAHLALAVPTRKGSTTPACGTEWTQCGGVDWSGPKCCNKGLACVKQSEWYSQCLTSDTTGCGNAEWRQCGGIGWTGETCCQEGQKCKYESDWWSSCQFDPDPTTTTTCTSFTSTKTHISTCNSPTASKTQTGFPTRVTDGAPTGMASPSASGASATNAIMLPTVTSKPSELRLSPDWDINACPQRREFWFEISSRPGAPDGFSRPMLVVNGQLPAPLIEVNAGDTVVAHVRNSLNFPIAIHWHGIQQNGTIWEDGPSGVTQCPIDGGGFEYTYEFKIVGEEPYGTYWWHAHRSGYYLDGITGAFIVHSPLDPLVRGVDFDIDQVIMFNDWYHTASDVIIGALNTPEGFNGTAVAPSPQSGLVNGYAIYDCSFANTTENDCEQNTRPMELVFPPDALVRLRFINSGGHPMTWFSVDEHELALVEADDTAVEPQLVHRIPVNVAQRYSGILNTTGHQVGDSFYLRSQINTGSLGTPFPDLDPQTRVVIRIGYKNSTLPTSLPTSTDWSDPTVGDCIDLDESTLVPLVAIDAPETVTQLSEFNSSFVIDDTNTFKWTLNDVSFQNFANNPILHQVWRNETVDSDRVAIVTAPLTSIDLAISNVQGADHPFHLHNIRMFVVARGTGLYRDSAAAGNVTLRLNNPIRRDTIGVPPGEWVLVRLRTDIPGVHAFHCHIVYHQAVGLLGALVVQPDVIRTFDIPADSLALCANGNTSVIDPGRKRSLPGGGPYAPRYELPAAPVNTALVKNKAMTMARKDGLFAGWW